MEVVTRMRAIINSKEYCFMCSPDSPISDAKESLFQFLKKVGEIEDQAKSAQAQKESEEVKVEEVKPQEVV